MVGVRVVVDAPVMEAGLMRQSMAQLVGDRETADSLELREDDEHLSEFVNSNEQNRKNKIEKKIINQI